MLKMAGFGNKPVIKEFREKRRTSAFNVRYNSKNIKQNKKQDDKDIEGPFESFTK
jgi:hypothetical protein